MVHLAAVAVALLPAVLANAVGPVETLLAARDDISQSLAWSELGCYRDTADRIMDVSERSSSLTKKDCKATCADYPYYGLQNGNECWCGDYRTNVDKHGSADNCNVGCTGKSKINCGGRWAMRAFTQAETDSDAIGCFKDNRSRVFDSVTSSENMSPQLCKATCTAEGKKYAGTQFGDECWCGDEGTDYDALGSATCDVPCSGDPTKMCGGAYALTVYELDGSSAPCYKDDTSARVGYNMIRSNDNSPEFCASYCNRFNAKWALVQFGLECFCGYVDTDVDQYGSADNCNIDCTGDNSLVCGGRSAFNAYELSGTGLSPSSSPSPSPSPSNSPFTAAPIMTIDTTCRDSLPSIRYAAGSGVSGRMYMEGAGCATMTDLYATRSQKLDGVNQAKGPIFYLSDSHEKLTVTPSTPTGKWLIEAELYITTGAVFYCKGTNIGGDCDELRIESMGSSAFHEIRGHGGSLYFENTIVTSWDTANKKPQETYEGGRSFLNCVSEYESNETCEGQPKNDYGECRMDMINSEIGYLGYFDSESYGITWKVRGFCKDLSNPEVFENTNVYGNIIGCDIHHNYYGHYTYGHEGGIWTGNKMHDNWQYGFDPHDDSDFLTIADNDVYNNVNHGIIASKRCNDVKIYDNRVSNGGAQAAGIFLHRSSDYAEVYNNRVTNMQDAGIAMLESANAKIYGNTITDTKYGIRMSLGSNNNEVYDNTFDKVSSYGLYHYEGSDEPDVSTGRPYQNVFTDNTISNTATGLKMKRVDDITFTGNKFTGTDLFEFNSALKTVWSGNSFPSDACYKIIEGSDKDGSIEKSTFASSSGLPNLC